MVGRKVWFCDSCGAQMEAEFMIIAWDLCPECVDAVRAFLHDRRNCFMTSARLAKEGA